MCKLAKQRSDDGSGDGSAEAPLESAWCSVCRRSSDVKWAKHAFTKSHQQRAADFLKQRSIVLSELLVIPRDGGGGIDSSINRTDMLQALATRKWSCRFCELKEYAADVVMDFLEGWRACIDHFASDAHRKKVEAFCRHHRCDVDRKLRTSLQLAPGKQRQLVKAFAEVQQQEALFKAEEQARADAAAAQAKAASIGAGSSTLSASSAERAEAFLSSAAARLQQVQVDRRQIGVAVLSPSAHGPMLSMMGPRLPVEGARGKTVGSADGILQNPLGIHEGRRVWGGGIVKLRKPNEWIPWPIDLLVKEENDRSASGTAGVKLYQDLNSEHDGGDRASFSHRVTDMAFGEGLGRISKVAWGDSVANVHTAAVPPWMVQSEEEYKRCNQRQLPSNGSIPGGQHSVQDVWTQKNGRVQNGPSETSASTGDSADTKEADDTSTQAAAAKRNDPNWLPNFGGVWQEGPRSKTKHEFAKLMPLRTPALQFRPASVYRRRRQVTPNQPPLPLTPVSSIPLLPPMSVSIAAVVPEPYCRQPSPMRADTSRNQNSVGETAVSSPPPLPPAAAVETAQPPVDPMDEKKRLLLAQKERLRAKMAAKRAFAR